MLQNLNLLILEKQVTKFFNGQITHRSFLAKQFTKILYYIFIPLLHTNKKGVVCSEIVLECLNNYICGLH
jgi:alpha-glucuronidase